MRNLHRSLATFLALSGSDLLRENGELSLAASQLERSGPVQSSQQSVAQISVESGLCAAAAIRVLVALERMAIANAFGSCVHHFTIRKKTPGPSLLL